MKPRKLKISDVVQLDAETCRNPHFRGCFMVVIEPKVFGAQGYICSPYNLREAGVAMLKPDGVAYYRAAWEEMHYVGRAEFILGDKEKTDDDAA